MKRQTVLVMSDLHLGGAPGFQICSPAGRALVADFLAWVKDRAAAKEAIHLVVNGDLVDFLAEEPFDALTVDDGLADRKLAAIIRNSREVWDAFAAAAAAGVQLTVLLGNHDLELALPRANARLRRALGPGRVGLLLDGQGLNLGDVLIEHGNRCDGWNLVNYDVLRRVASDLSRNERPPEFPAPPGSRLVVEVMNHVKKELRFVDLLKPETDSVLPLLAALATISFGQVHSLIEHYREAGRAKFGPGQRPVDHSLIASPAPGVAEPVPPGAALALEILAGDPSDDDGRIGAIDTLDFFHLWRAGRTKGDNRALLDRLYTALRHRLANSDEAFAIDHELPEYVAGATGSIGRGFKAVIYGHTHLAKRKTIGNGLYLNTGTWADLMRVPRAVVQGNRLAALAELDVFVSDLAENRLERWRRPLPTFASFELEVDDGDPAEEATPGRLVGEPQVFAYGAGGVSTPLSDTLFTAP